MIALSGSTARDVRLEWPFPTNVMAAGRYERPAFADYGVVRPAVAGEKNWLAFMIAPVILGIPKNPVPKKIWKIPGVGLSVCERPVTARVSKNNSPRQEFEATRLRPPQRAGAWLFVSPGLSDIVRRQVCWTPLDHTGLLVG